jgi:quercetin dioxygenase-like cupin family protein
MELIRHDDWIKGKSYRKKILLDNFNKQLNLIEDIVIEANGEIPLHKHNFTDEIFYIRENSVIMIVDDQNFKVNEGDMIYVEKNERHGFKNESNKESKMIVIKINFQRGDSYLK